MIPRPGVQVVASVPVAGPVPPPISVVRPPESAVSHQLRANKMNVGVDPARRDDFSFAGDHFRSCAHNQFRESTPLIVSGLPALPILRCVRCGCRYRL